MLEKTLQDRLRTAVENSKKTGSRAGWRFFECPKCSLRWKETTRDRHSLSGVNCLVCEWPCAPRWSSNSPEVETDDMGSLKKFESVVISSK